MKLWIDRLITVFVFLVFSVILYILEMKNRAILSNRSIDQKWIDRWALLSCTACLLRLFQLLGYSLPKFCLYINSLYVPVFLLIPLFITFYQISRLQYCFKSDHGSHYFIILYLNGVLVTLFSIISGNLTQKVVNLHENACIMEVKSPFHSILVGIGLLWYYMWDFYIIFIYIYKIKQLKNRVIDSSVQSSNMSLKRVNIFLRKILILTIIIEITNFLWGLLVSLRVIRQKLFILDCVNITITHICVLLMIEHNNDKYVKVMRLFTSNKLCCCCNKFVRTTMKQTYEEEIEQKEAITIEFTEVTQRETQRETQPFHTIPLASDKKEESILFASKKLTKEELLIYGYIRQNSIHCASIPSDIFMYIFNIYQSLFKENSPKPSQTEDLSIFTSSSKSSNSTRNAAHGNNINLFIPETHANRFWEP